MSPKVLTWIGVALAMLVGCTREPTVPTPAPINGVVGDVSWIACYGTPPDADADESERVQTHLAWVIEQLAANEPPDLAPAASHNRAARLADLARYAARGNFPQLDAPIDGSRVPRFRDADGTWCAVGFLVASSGAEAVATDIAAHHEYARIAQIDDPRLDRWAAEQGFTRRELATIQPEYSFLGRCTKWGTSKDDDGECANERLKKHRLAIGFGFGGGTTRDDGALSSYLLWGVRPAPGDHLVARDRGR